MTIAQLLQKCEALSTEFNTAARTMDGKALSAYRKQLERRYHVQFLNGWTVRMQLHVEDVFHAQVCRTLTRSKKTLLGGTVLQYLTALTLTSPGLPACGIACTVQNPAPPTADSGDVHAAGTLEVSVVLLSEGLVWKDAALTGKSRVRWL